MQTPRRYAPMGGSFAPVRVAGFKWNGWQTSAVYARYSAFTVRRAIFMWGMKHVDAKHFRPAASQLIKRC